MSPSFSFDQLKSLRCSLSQCLWCGLKPKDNQNQKLVFFKYFPVWLFTILEDSSLSVPDRSSTCKLTLSSSYLSLRTTSSSQFFQTPGLGAITVCPLTDCLFYVSSSRSLSPTLPTSSFFQQRLPKIQRPNLLIRVPPRRWIHFPRSNTPRYSTKRVDSHSTDTLYLIGPLI